MYLAQSLPFLSKCALEKWTSSTFGHCSVQKIENSVFHSYWFPLRST